MPALNIKNSKPTNRLTTTIQAHNGQTIDLKSIKEVKQENENTKGYDVQSKISMNVLQSLRSELEEEKKKRIELEKLVTELLNTEK